MFNNVSIFAFIVSMSVFIIILALLIGGILSAVEDAQQDAMSQIDKEEEDSWT